MAPNRMPRNITLWDYVKMCKCPIALRKDKHGDHVTRFTGALVKPVWPLTNEISLTLLMVHVKRDWKTQEDLLGDFGEYNLAMADFMDNSPDCPDGLKLLLYTAKARYDKRVIDVQMQKQKKTDKKKQNAEKRKAMREVLTIKNSCIQGSPMIEQQSPASVPPLDLLQPISQHIEASQTTPMVPSPVLLPQSQDSDGELFRSIGDSQSSSFMMGSQMSQAKYDEGIEALTLGQCLIEDLSKDAQVCLFDPTIGDIILPNGGPNYDWRKHGIDHLNMDESQIPNDITEWLSNAQKVVEMGQEASVRELDLPSVNPLLVNHKQRIVVYNTMDFLLKYKQNMLTKEEIKVGRRLLIQGPAGTGKSQAILIITRLSRRLFKTKNAAINVAPTGAAAVLLPDGKTIHSLAHPPMRLKKSENGSPIENPLSANHMKLFVQLVAPGGKIGTMSLNIDERSMVGCSLASYLSHRFHELNARLQPNGLGNTEELDKSFGSILSVNFFGDIFQLGSVGDRDLYLTSHEDAPPSWHKGHAIYNTFTDVVVLHELMRQNSDQVRFRQLLGNIRLGQITQADHMLIQQRLFDSLPPQEREEFENDNSILLAERWSDANEYNDQIFIKRGKPVAIIDCEGNSARHFKRSEADKQMRQIPETSFMSHGARVMLTKNQGSLTQCGLNNGALGTIVGWIFEKYTMPPLPPLVIVVNFPGYDGPPFWIDVDRRHWVPLPRDTLRCESNCCHRTNFPIIPGYAITIHKSQGMSIGSKHMVQKAILHLRDEPKAEQTSLGLTYTAFSKCTELGDWCIKEPFPFDRLSKSVNQNKAMPGRITESNRLEKMSLLTEQNHSITVAQYVDLIRKIDIECNDNIHDHICLKTACTCCGHT